MILIRVFKVVGFIFMIMVIMSIKIIGGGVIDVIIVLV